MSIPVSNHFIGKPTISFDELDSTNKFATDLISKNKPTEGTVIKASFQSLGRGQIGRTWHSKAGLNSLCSTILYPIFLKAQQQFFLNICVSVALRDTIQSFVEQKVLVKWPNDIYVDDKKIAGILIQNSISGKYLQNCVIGTGINVNQTDFPSHLPNPSSIAMLTGIPINIESVEKLWYHHLELNYGLLKSRLYSALNKSYLKHFYWKDEIKSFEADQERFSGIIRGVDEHGRLIIEKEEGINKYQFREIKFLI